MERFQQINDFYFFYIIAIGMDSKYIYMSAAIITAILINPMAPCGQTFLHHFTPEG
jgi:hypothetical protein